jgi:hypothetical protein
MTLGEQQRFYPLSPLTCKVHTTASTRKSCKPDLVWPGSLANSYDGYTASVAIEGLALLLALMSRKLQRFPIQDFLKAHPYLPYCISYITATGQQSRTPTCTRCWLRTYNLFIEPTGDKRILMELLWALLSYDGVAPVRRRQRSPSQNRGLPSKRVLKPFDVRVLD